jgi:DNA-directed RNA polymerase beta' subunit
MDIFEKDKVFGVKETVSVNKVITKDEVAPERGSNGGNGKNGSNGTNANNEKNTNNANVVKANTIGKDVKQITKLQFSIPSPFEILSQSVGEISSTTLDTAEGSLYDSRMGVIGNGECRTCGQKMIGCPGHFGHITLEEPVIHPFYQKTIYNIVKCVCSDCSALLISKEQMSILGISKLKTEERIKRLVMLSAKEQNCNKCGEPVPTIKLSTNKKLKLSYDGKAVTLKTRDIYDILSKITNDDFNAMGFNENLLKNVNLSDEKYFVCDKDIMFHRHQNRPEWMIITILPVLPICSRPPSMVAGESHDDDLTAMYSNVIKNNKLLQGLKKNTNDDDDKKKKPKKAKKVSQKEIVNLLQIAVKAIIDNSDGKSRVSGGRPHKDLKARMSKKEGQVRKNIMGKRVDFSARTVIGGDPTLETDELGLPKKFASSLTKPEYITELNIKSMQEIVNRKEANFVFRSKDPQIQIHIPTYKGNFIIKVGDVVERHLRDGDYVLLNRQPTLRIESMMGVRVKVMPHGDTMRFNLAITTPFNADFDGDEMNIHVPQDYQSTAELQTFMSVPYHIVSSQHNAPIIGLVQDALIGSYILTSDDEFVPRTVFYDCILDIKHIDIDLNDFLKRAIKYYPDYIKYDSSSKGYKFKKLIPGKLLFSLIFKNNFFYEKKTRDVEHGFVDKDNKPRLSVIIKEGIIVPESVPLCKKVLGGKPNSIIHILYKEYGMFVSRDFISNSQFIINRWFPSRGFSVGIVDCMIENNEKIVDTLIKAEAECMEKIQIGSELVEKEINSILNSTTSVGMQITKEGMMKGKKNSLVMMFESGAKGNHINSSQITAFVAQQNVKGRRIPKLLSDGKRCLPFYTTEDISSESRGFVNRPYMAGLTPQQTYFHAMGGREGLIDTAIKTAQTGYAQRRIVKKTEDLKTHIDGSVRSNNNSIVQFMYGSDGWNAGKLYYVNNILFFIDPMRISRQMNYEYDNSKDYKGEKVRKLTNEEMDNICEKLNVSYIKSENARKVHESCSEQLKKFLKDVMIYEAILPKFVYKIESTYYDSVSQAGDMVGIIASCSIGEPTTQGTLNTFHSAGISEKDVTLGISRLEECLDATHNPKTPSCLIYLNNNIKDSEKARLEKLEFAQSKKKIYQYVDVEFFTSCKPKLKYVEGITKDMFPPFNIYKFEKFEKYWWVNLYEKMHDVKIKANKWILELDFDLEKMFQYSISLSEIAKLIEQDNVFGNFSCITSPNNIGKIIVYIDFDSDIKPLTKTLDFGTGNKFKLINETNMFFFYTKDIVVQKLLKLKISGIEGIPKVYFREINNEWVIDTQGCNYIEILSKPETNFSKTICDDFWQTLYVLGIEAAREVLYLEFVKAICGTDTYINSRHIQLLVDSMTSTGTITNIRREGIDKSVGTLAKCAFERTVDIFSLAGITGELEDANSVSSSIILGKNFVGGSFFNTEILDK